MTTEEELAKQIISHWFIQGGAAQFGAITGGNADELIAQILSVVRARISEGEQMAEDAKTWYGPQQCGVCGNYIITAAREEGGAEFDPPQALMRVYQRGAESGNVDLVYPMAWTPHVHGPNRNPQETASE